MNKCSEIFENAFSSHSSGIVRTCKCARTWFNGLDKEYFEKGEYEKLCEKAKRDPENYIECDHSVATMMIDGEEIVIGCKCDIAKKYEKFIMDHDIQIAEYLNKRAEKLKEIANKIGVLARIPEINS